MREETKKKGLPLPILIIIIGLVIGALVAGFGLIKYNDAKKTNEERYNAALAESQKKVDAANARLKEIEEDLNTLNENYNDKADECIEIDKTMGKDSNWFANSTKCKNEKSNLNSEINTLKLEQSSLLNANYTVYYDLVKPMTYQIYYIIGGSIAGAGLLAAFIIYLVKGKKTY